MDTASASASDEPDRERQTSARAATDRIAREGAAVALLRAARELEGMRRDMEDSAPSIMLAGGSSYVTGRYSALSDAIELLQERARRLQV